MNTTIQSKRDCDCYCYWYVTLMVFWITRWVFVRSHSLRWDDVRLNTIPGKWRSGKLYFKKMTFGYTTIRENKVRLNKDSEKCRSALWSLGNLTIRLCDHSVELRLVAFFFRWDNDSVKWRFGITKIRSNYVRWCCFRRDNDSVK